MNTRVKYRFGPFQMDAAEGLLRRDGAHVPLTPKAFDTLLLLVERGGHVVSKDEIMRRVWADSFVEENNLSQNISLLRKTLGAGYIETVSKRGYRLTVEVAGLPEDAPDAPRVRMIHAPEQMPETHYARNGDVNIAYQIIGDAPLDLVFVMGWVSHLEYFWREPSFARFLRRLASFSRLILFDKRGTGLSDRVPLNELPTLEQRMDDVRCVMEAVGSERAALCGVSEGGPMSALFAATYPERTIALTMIGTYAKRVWAHDYPWAPTKEARQEFYEEMQRGWGGAVGLEERAPSVAGDAQFREWWATYLRMGASPGAALALTKMNADIDVRHVLGSIRVPTLVIHRAGDACLKIEEGRYVAERIPGARFVELPGIDHLPFVGDQDAILDELEEFLIRARHTHESDRVLATVLAINFLDLHATAEKDVPKENPYGRALYEQLTARARKEIDRFRGRDLTFEATNLIATFDGPARAIRAACAIHEYATRLGVEIKAGLHTGECDVLANGMVAGIAVEIGAQVAAHSANEVLVSSTVKDLVAGSGINFRDRGAHTLGDTLGEWRLFGVERDT